MTHNSWSACIWSLFLCTMSENLTPCVCTRKNASSTGLNKPIIFHKVSEITQGRCIMCMRIPAKHTQWFQPQASDILLCNTTTHGCAYARFFYSPNTQPSSTPVDSSTELCDHSCVRRLSFISNAAIPLSLSKKDRDVGRVDRDMASPLSLPTCLFLPLSLSFYVSLLSSISHSLPLHWVWSLSGGGCPCSGLEGGSEGGRSPSWDSGPWAGGLQQTQPAVIRPLPRFKTPHYSPPPVSMQRAWWAVAWLHESQRTAYGRQDPPQMLSVEWLCVYMLPRS